MMVCIVGRAVEKGVLQHVHYSTMPIPSLSGSVPKQPRKKKRQTTAAFPSFAPRAPFGGDKGGELPCVYSYAQRAMKIKT
jgi:hypothetical protein